MRAWDRLAPSPLEDVSERKDILADERAGGGSRLARFRVVPWPVGRLGVAVLIGFIVVTFGFALLVRGGGSEVGPWDGGVWPSGVAHAEAGRGLFVDEAVAASMFGTPRELGRGGLPVVEHRLTGDVRELTPVEMEFFQEAEGRDVPFLPAEGERVVWTPGPLGWGVWWVRDPLLESMSSYTVYDRAGWLEKQRSELQLATDQVGVAVAMLTLMEFDPWKRGVSPVMYQALEAMRQRHEFVDIGGQWGGVPVQWVCEEQLEIAVNGVVNNGCPPEVLGEAISAVWARLGYLGDQLYGVARLGVVMDSLPLGTLYDSGVLQQQGLAVLDLEDDVRAFYLGLAQLEEYSSVMGYRVRVVPFSPVEES